MKEGISMFCNHCGKELNNNEKYCSGCGNPVSNNTMINSNYSTPVMKSQSNNKIIYIIMGVLGMIIIALVVLLILKYLPKSSKNSESSTKKDKEEVADIKTNAYQFHDFEFPIPEGYEVEEFEYHDKIYLRFLNYHKKIEGFVDIFDECTLEDVLDELDPSNFEEIEEGDITSDMLQEKTYSNVDWLIYNDKDEDGFYLYAFASFGDSRVLRFDFYDYISNQWSSFLKDFSKMIKETTYKGSSTFSPPTSKTKIDFDRKDFPSKIYNR